MRLIFNRVDTNNNTNLKYIIPNDNIIENSINTESVNNSKQILSIDQIYDFLESKFHEHKQEANKNPSDIEVMRIMTTKLHDLLKKFNNAYTKTYLGTRLNIIYNKFKYDTELTRKLSVKVSTESYNYDDLKNTIDNLGQPNIKIISRFLRYATCITTRSNSSAGKITHSLTTEYDINVFRKMYTIFLDSIPIFDLNAEDFLKKTVNSGLDNNTIIYCPETIGDVMFLKNRNELSQINIVTDTNKRKLSPGINHYITITGTCEVTENQELKWERNMEFSENDTKGEKKFNQIEYVVNTLKNQ